MISKTIRDIIKAVVATSVLCGCGDNNEISVVHYNGDHESDIEILDINGAMIASEHVSPCGIITTSGRKHSAVDFAIDPEYESVIIKSNSRGRDTIEVINGETY